VLVATLIAFTLGPALAAAGVAKLRGAPAIEEVKNRLGIRRDRWNLIGIAEIAGAVGLIGGLWIAPLALAASLGCLSLMVAAVVQHQRSGDQLPDMIPALIGIAMALVYLVLVASR